MPETEIWKPIPGYEGRYDVSSLGRVRSCSRLVNCSAGKRRIAECVLKLHTNAYGYLVATVWMDGVGKPTGVNRLVCAAFHGPPPSPEHQAAHNDGNRTNNHYKNLRWATKQENEADKEAHGTKMCGERNHLAAFTNDEVREIRRRATTETYQQLAAAYGVNFGTIGKIVRRVSYANV